MKPTAIFALLLLIVLSCNKPHSANNTKPQADTVFWTKEKAVAYLADRENPAAWDTTMFKDDMAFSAGKYNFPFSMGVFPTPKYDRVGKGSFKGLGNYGNTKYIQGKSIALVSFVVNKSPVNASYIKADSPNEIYFTIAVLTDKADTATYSHTMNTVISRNHPDYIGQGYINTSVQKIDYTAFLTAGRNSYAIVNMRLFDLQNGALVLIAPHADKSLRSMQIATPALSTNTIDSYTDSLFRQKNIIAFFTEKGTI